MKTGEGKWHRKGKGRGEVETAGDGKGGGWRRGGLVRDHKRK